MRVIKNNGFLKIEFFILTSMTLLLVILTIYLKLSINDAQHKKLDLPVNFGASGIIKNNLKTYTDSINGFSLEYPGNWKKEVPKKDHIRFYEDKPLAGNAVEIGIYPNSDNLTAKDFVDKIFYSYVNQQETKRIWLNEIKTRKVEVYGKKATIIEGLVSFPGPYGPALWITEGSTGIFILSINPSEEGINIFNGIVSSFKFI